MTPQQVLDLPMDDNDAGAKTIREYLVSLVEMLWVEGEGFSGKRPFGNSGWEAELLDTFDNADENLSEKSKSNLIREAIRSLKSNHGPELIEYIARIEKAIAVLGTMTDELASVGEDVNNHIRLRGKIQGLKLALSYLKEDGG